MLKKLGKAVLAGFIVAQDTHRKASVAMAQTELLVKSPSQGLPLQNPYLPIVSRQMVLMTRVASELGFTPYSRARIDAGAAPAPVVTIGRYRGWLNGTAVEVDFDLGLTQFNGVALS